MALTIDQLPIGASYNAGTDILWVQASGSDRQVTIKTLLEGVESILPKADLLYDIGSPTQRFRNIYAYELFIGAHSLYVNGKMPIVKIYNIALSAAQVLQNYNATKGRFGL